MIAAIRVRGSVNVTIKIAETMHYLRLNRTNHLVIVPDNKSFSKMIEKSKDYITFGQINEETLAKVIEKRGRLEGDKKLDAQFLKQNDFNGFADLAKNLLAGKTTLKKLGVKPVLRLHPPRKGYERQGIKKPFKLGGALGNRGEKINGLIESMM